ncbi:DUF6318 family protein [Pseudarthrobacter sp. J64]|uniref:DUF6318 family protein n=1 Tax=Pseudarthrobacter sp. J64 TaxID=3116485 RepID=UPI002E80AE85|nr:DUF6318 family protein [Pseudarthrobacter sp. J64]MEE2570707.1 DUF6318 family protein [Pseudarthrobacter sp. J64]
MTPTETPAATDVVTPTASPTARLVYRRATAFGPAENVQPPKKPELAVQNSKDGLEAFTRYWFALLNHGYETGDHSLWLQSTFASCQYCANIRSSIDEVFRDGGWQAGGTVDLKITKPTLRPSEPQQQVLVDVRQEATAYFKADGSQAGTSDPADSTEVVILANFKDGWTVEDMHPVR